MTDETIEKIIDALNRGEAPDLIFLRPLTDKVFIGRVWLTRPSGSVCNEESYAMFFIRNRRKTFVAAILDMGKQDLHVFVKPKHRGKGYLAVELRNVVLPFLFATGRKEQNITFRTEGARHHAEKVVGFHCQTENTGVITPEDLPISNIPVPKKIAPSDKQVKRIQQRIREAAALLRVARDDIQTAFGDDETATINAVASDAEDVAFRIHDLWYDQQLKGNK